MKAYQRKRRAKEEKRIALGLLSSGVPPEKIGRPETQRARLKALLRDRTALRARIEWQSGGIKTLRGELTTLKALLATQPAMLDLTVLQRLTQIEAGEALRSAGLPIAGWAGIEETVDHDMEDSHD